VPTLENLLTDYARELRDAEPGHEFTQFPRETLLIWWNEALCILHRMRPDLFTRSREVTLVPGNRQSVGEDCTFKSVDANLGPQGQDETPIRMTSVTAMRQWGGKPTCIPPPKEYRVTEFQFDKMQRDIFYVAPPVPAGATAKVRVTCVEPPPTLTVSDLGEEAPTDCWQNALVNHYLLAQAYAQDSDQMSLALAQHHQGLWGALFRGTLQGDLALQAAQIPTPPEPRAR
jgi:hypothetical protein